MARSVDQLIRLAVLAILSVHALAEPLAVPEKKRRRDPDATPSPEFENVRKALNALTPEQRKRFQENFWRWANLPPDEKKSLRGREEVRRRVMEQEVQAAIQESGLQLNSERQQHFMRRYGEERKKIEEQLRRESMEKRKPMVREMIARLKAEFSAEPTVPEDAVAPAAPTVAPASPLAAPVKP
jgi:flagellar biosynthesis GTPase FlhF